MIENVNGLKKVDVFNDIVSRLEDSKKARVSDDVVSGMKNYYNNKQDYRDRVNLLAANLKGVKPIDNLINNVVYLSNFMEKGIAIKTSIISFKQIWIEYRLIYNENNLKKEDNLVYSAPASVNEELGHNDISNQIDMFNNVNVTNDQFTKFEAPSIDSMFNTGNKDNNDLNGFDYNNSMFNNNQSLNETNSGFNMSNNVNDVKIESSNNKLEFNPFNAEVTNNGLDNGDIKFEIPSLPTNNFGLDNLEISNTISNDKLDDNYKKLYNKVINLSKYVEQFNKRKFELDRQIASLEDKKRNLSNELRELENAKKEFSRYKLEEEKKINSMKNEVNSKVVSLQNLIDNLDSILGKIN